VLGRRGLKGGLRKEGVGGLNWRMEGWESSWGIFLLLEGESGRNVGGFVDISVILPGFEGGLKVAIIYNGRDLV